MNYIVLYQDKGPDGPCGQTASITNPWTILMIFDDHEELRKFANSLHLMGRRKPTLTWINRIEVHREAEVLHFDEEHPLPLGI